jgi:Lanthionine-containing peptide SapB precursor RamS
MALLDLQSLQVSAEYCDGDGRGFGHGHSRDCGSNISLLLCG